MLRSALAHQGGRGWQWWVPVKREVTAPELTDRIITQGKALVWAIKARGTIERTPARLLLAAYKRRLRAIVEAAPAWAAEEILSASERIGDGRAVQWLSRN